MIGNNEIIIFKQYLTFNSYRVIFFFTLFIVAIFFINGEIISPKSYNKYKIKEIEIRNNFNLGIPSNNQLNIKDEVRFLKILMKIFL